MRQNNLKALAERTEFVLGSGSPRRQQIIRNTGIDFRIEVSHVDETQLPDEDPYVYAERVACDKALEVSRRVNNGAVVLGCDTVVVLGKQILPKPDDEGDALATLKTLSGRNHVVCTALAFARSGEILASGSDRTRVYFNPVSEQQIVDYIKTGEPMDKAGAYGIQGMGAFLVDRIEGSLDTVIGLPRALLERLAGKVLLEL